jgi:hypothetical protein
MVVAPPAVSVDVEPEVVVEPLMPVWPVEPLAVEPVVPDALPLIDVSEEALPLLRWAVSLALEPVVLVVLPPEGRVEPVP